MFVQGKYINIYTTSNKRVLTDYSAKYLFKVFKSLTSLCINERMASSKKTIAYFKIPIIRMFAYHLNIYAYVRLNIWLSVSILERVIIKLLRYI